MSLNTTAMLLVKCCPLVVRGLDSAEGKLQKLPLKAALLTSDLKKQIQVICSGGQMFLL